MKKFAALILLITSIGFAQMEDVPVTHKVYPFLERLSVLELITGYNSFEIPISRKQAALFLIEASKNSSRLDGIDIQTLADLKREFSFDIDLDLNFSRSILGAGSYDPLSQQPKYIYFYSEPESGSFFINCIAEAGNANYNIDQYHNNSLIGLVGGEVRGTLMNKFGFFLRATNGNVFGNKSAALHIHRLSYNWNLSNNFPPSSFFDETNGYLTVDFDVLKLKFGRDRQLIGFGENKLILGDNAPETDFLSMKLKLGILEYTFYHGKILGDKGSTGDTITGLLNTVEEKYLAYHRIGFNLSKDFSFGAGEMTIYSNRGLDLSYMNPFIFYKAVEHGGQDRDNSLLFFNVSSNAIKGMKLYSILLIDDISYGRVGTGWYGNQTVWNIGIESSCLYPFIPADVSLEYFRIEPYVFTHRFHSNNYTHNGYNIALDTDPNSKLFFGKINYRITNRIDVDVSYTYKVHGANPIDTVTGKITNVGGDLNLGHRTQDAEYLKFLEGDIEYYRKLAFAVRYEPFLGHFISLIAEKETNSLRNNVTKKTTFFNLNISLRI